MVEAPRTRILVAGLMSAFTTLSSADETLEGLNESIILIFHDTFFFVVIDNLST
ncbi:hypothetical protein MHYP_G00051200 [Metynnis hypsauchen]